MYGKPLIMVGYQTKANSPTNRSTNEIIRIASVWNLFLLTFLLREHESLSLVVFTFGKHFTELRCVAILAIKRKCDSYTNI